jgi:hypothetical protein
MTGFQALGDGQQILAILAILYFSEGACWLPRSAVCFSAAWRQYRPLRAATFLRNERGGLIFFSLPPFSAPLICQPWPLCISPAGIRLGGDTSGGVQPPTSSGPKQFAYDEIQSVESRHVELLINGRAAARCASTEIARGLAESLSTILKTPPAAREGAIESILQSATDVEAIRARLALLRTQGFVLTLASTCFFVFTFVLGYLLLCVPQGVPYQSGIYFAGLAATWLVTVTCFWVAHRKIFPGQNRERRQRIAMMLLVPTGAMRAPATLSRNLLANLHPLAVASVLCSAETFRALAQRTLLSINQLAHATASGAGNGGDATAEWFYSRLSHHLADVVRLRGLEPTELLQAPTPDPDALSYCPRCHAQFVVLSGVCRECRTATLIPFSRANATEGMQVGMQS